MNVLVDRTDARGRWRGWPFSRTLTEESAVNISTPISAAYAVVAVSALVDVYISQSNNSLL